MKRNRTVLELAAQAVRLLLTVSPHGQGLGRSFDACFEAGNGDAVYRIVKYKAASSLELRLAIEQHGYGYWLKDEDAMADTAPTQRELFASR